MGEKKIKDKIRENIMDDIDHDTIENSLVNGFMKLWLYQSYLLSRTSWAFLIYDFGRTLLFELKKEMNLKLKKWAGYSGQKIRSLLSFLGNILFGVQTIK